MNIVQRNLLLVILIAFTSLIQPISARSQNAWHLEEIDRKRVKITDIVTFHYPTPPELVLAATIPPVLPTQIDTSLIMWNGLNMVGEVKQENSPLHRPIVWADVKASSTNPTITLVYEATLVRRRLTRGLAQSPVLPISDIERKEALAATKIVDFDKTGFAAWLDSEHLRPADSESELAFGYRVFSYIKAKYSYYHDSNSGSDTRTANFLRTQNKADCGELEALYAAIMRANSRPFLLNVGRNLISENGSYGVQCHVKGTFYAQGIGWIPVEVTGALGQPENTDVYTFGCDNEWFLTTHVENNLIFDTKYWGMKQIEWASVLRFWNSVTLPSDPTEQWQVTDIPLSSPKIVNK